jgi:hypothetical protein
LELGRPLAKGSHRDQVDIGHRAYVWRFEGDERLGAPGGGHELDLDPVRFLDLHHGAKITSAQIQVRKIPIQNNGIENLGFHASSRGKAVT